MSRKSRSQENNHLHTYSLWCSPTLNSSSKWKYFNQNYFLSDFSFYEKDDWKTITYDDNINTVKVGVEGHLDPSTGKFTAPRSGVYFFTALGREHKPSGWNLNMRLVVNSKWVKAHSVIDTTNEYASQSFSAYVDLATGDFVEVKMWGYTYSDPHRFTCFGGHLVAPKV